MQVDELHHELVNMLGDWLTLADQAIAKRAERNAELPLAMNIAYLSGYEDGLR